MLTKSGRKWHSLPEQLLQSAGHHLESPGRSRFLVISLGIGAGPPTFGGAPVCERQVGANKSNKGWLKIRVD